MAMFQTLQPLPGTKYEIPKVTAKKIMEVVEGLVLSADRGLSLSDVMRYASISEEYARRALKASVQLRMAVEKDGKHFRAPDTSDVGMGSHTEWAIIFRKFLQRYPPFIMFLIQLGKGNKAEDAARKLATIYAIQDNTDDIKTTFTGWGNYADVLESDRKGSIKLKVETPKLEAEYIRDLLAALENDIKARIYVGNKLTEDVFGYLHQDEIELVISAIRRHADDPTTAVEHVGKAFEDFLRRIGIEKNQGPAISQKNGIGGLAGVLKDQGIIHEKLFDMCSYVNTMRIASAHHKEKGTMIVWNIRPDAAIETILVALTAMRSIFLYAFRQQYSL